MTYINNKLRDEYLSTAGQLRHRTGERSTDTSSAVCVKMKILTLEESSIGTHTSVSLVGEAPRQLETSAALRHTRRQVTETSFPMLPRVGENIICAVINAGEELVFQAQRNPQLS